MVCPTMSRWYHSTSRASTGSFPTREMTFHDLNANFLSKAQPQFSYSRQCRAFQLNLIHKGFIEPLLVRPLTWYQLALGEPTRDSCPYTTAPRIMCACKPLMNPHNHKPSPNLQSTSRLDGQTPMIPPATLQGYTVVTLLHSLLPRGHVGQVEEFLKVFLPLTDY